MKGIIIMEKKNVIEMAVYDREHLSHNMFSKMDWERDSIMRELDGAAVPQLPAASAQK